jgi:hypothetical protein
MTAPDWRNPKLSGIKRIALWLHEEVTPSGVFTKQQMRNALSTPQKEEQDEQLDRRMRDLRDEGWVISTYREDRSLTQRQLRLVQEGGALWQDGYQSRKGKVPTARQRQTVFAADDYMCRFCGIGAGERYPEDTLRTAKLTVSSGGYGLVTCCDHCRAGRPEIGSADEVLSALAQLSEDERAAFKGWIAAGRRNIDAVTRLWTRYNQLPHEQRQTVEAGLLAS